MGLACSGHWPGITVGKSLNGRWTGVSLHDPGVIVFALPLLGSLLPLLMCVMAARFVRWRLAAAIVGLVLAVATRGRGIRTVAWWCIAGPG